MCIPMAQTGNEIVGSVVGRETVLEEQGRVGCCENNNMKEKKRKHDVVVVVRNDHHGAIRGGGEEEEEADGRKKRCKVGLAQAWSSYSGCSLKYLKPSYWMSKVEVCISNIYNITVLLLL